MVFFPASIRKNTPAARLSHIDKFLAVFSTLFFLIFRTVSWAFKAKRVNTKQRVDTVGPGLVRSNEGVTETFIQTDSTK